MDLDRQTMSGLMFGGLETEERSSAAAAHLHIVNDEQDAVPLAKLSQIRQPLQRGHVDPALALHSLHDHCGHRLQPDAAVLQQRLNPRRARFTAVQSRQPNGTGMACGNGTPAPSRWNLLLVTASAPSVMPWKAPVKVITSVRPVALRASLSAASTAFVPPGPGNCIR